MPWDALADEFVDGDILYGLDQGRGAAKQAILARRRVVEKEHAVFCCFVTTKRFERILIQNDITNTVFDPARPGLRDDATIRKTAAVRSDPARATAFRDFVGNHPKYGLGDYKPSAPDPMSGARTAWLKASKAGLEFQVKHRPEYRIHFVLDGLDFARVLEQRAEPSEVARSAVRSPLDITSAEVRWLFRNRSNPNVDGAVVFWLDGKKTPPPWEWPRNGAHFANFLYTKSAHLEDEAASREFKLVLDELRSAVVLQRLFRGRRGRYYVREGDTLASIADRHGVSVADLQRWNALAGSNLVPGQVLTVRA